MALKILLADDSMAAQNMGKKILTDAGYEVVAVSNGAAAIKKLAETSPNLCILDIYMPGYTGLEVCEKIKGAAATSRIPVLLTVGKHEPYKPEEGARVRADGVIVKPFEASELLRAVHRFSQRLAAGQNRAHVPIQPAPPPSSTPAIYERTVKLTREQIQEYMEPGMTNWQGGTAGAVATSQTASTADSMPTFAVATVADTTAPAEIVERDETAAMVDLDPAGVAVSELPEVSRLERPPAAIVEAALPNASAVLPGFTDYVLANSHNGNGLHAAAPVEMLPIETPFGVHPAEPIDNVEHVEIPLESTVPVVVDATAWQDSPATSKWSTPESIGYDIPTIDPALEVAPAVAIEGTPDPQFEVPQDLPVANATETGLEPTSRSTESEGVTTTTDPNLAPMEGLIDAVQPLEGGRLEITHEDPPASAAGTLAMPEVAEVEPTPVVEAAAPAPETVVESKPASFWKKLKKSKEMRPVPPARIAEPPAPVDEAPPSEVQASGAVEEAPNAAVVDEPVPAVVDEPEVAPVAKGDVTQEIAAVLNLLGQTTTAVIPGATTKEFGEVDDAPTEENLATTLAAASRVWMAEEVALSDVEAMMSLEHEMRVAYAPKQVDSRISDGNELASAGMQGSGCGSDVATALAEEPVRDDKITSQSAGPEMGGLPPGSGASPTQDLAAAMAAAFGGALPQEDLARAEETQSISEEVRRFALGDAYKAKPGFGGAAIDDPAEKGISAEKLSAAIERALDRLKPRIVAEILKELQGGEDE